MTNSDRVTLDELLPGMQLAFFEIIWRLFPWIQSIWVREKEGELQLFVVTAATPDKQHWDNLAYHIKGELNAAEKALDELEPNAKHTIRFMIQYGAAVPNDSGYREVMSDRVFRKMAKRHAPWRLENGR